MARLDERLVRCISSVVPTMTEESIRAVDVASLMDVDSLAAVTLLTLINEEFGVDMDLDNLLKLGSFKAVQQFLCEQVLEAPPAEKQMMK